MATDILVETADALETDGLVGLGAGIATGEILADTNLFQSEVYRRAESLAKFAEAEQILVDLPTREMARVILPDDYGFQDMGSHTLGGASSPERLYQLLHPQLRRAFREVRTVDARHNNLPIRTTVFVGRKTELADISNRLPDAQCLTLVGPAGIGKSSLAIRVALEQLEEYADGVYYVDLRNVSAETEFYDALLQVLRIKPSNLWSAEEAVCLNLGAKECLLLIDNAEHFVRQLSRKLERFLQQCPSVQVLFTTRRPLRVPAESRYLIGPLRQSEQPTMEAAEESDAALLYEDRARLVDPSFSLREDNIADVCEICRRLDGNPLAIELAASRAATLPPASLLASWGELDVEETLESMLRWTAGLLDTADQIVYRRLSMMEGTITLENAMAVAAEPGTRTPVLTKILERLVECYLLAKAEPILRNEFVFELTGPSRNLAQRLLKESGEVEATRLRHTAWIIGEGALCRERAKSSDQDLWAARYARMGSDIRKAILTAIDGGRELESANIISAFSTVWIRWTDLDPRDFLDRFQRAFPDGAEVDSLRVLNLSGLLYDTHGEYALARRSFLSLIWRAKKLRHANLGLKGLSNLGRLEFRIGSKRLAARYVRLALNVSGVDVSPVDAASLVLGSALMLIDEGRFQEAEDILKQIRNRKSVLKDRFLEMHVVNTEAILAAADGNLELALERAIKAAVIANKSGYQSHFASISIRLVELELRQAEFERALKLVSSIRGACARREVTLEGVDLMRAESAYQEARFRGTVPVHFAEEWASIPLVEVFGILYYI